MDTLEDNVHHINNRNTDDVSKFDNTENSEILSVTTNETFNEYSEETQKLMANGTAHTPVSNSNVSCPAENPILLQDDERNVATPELSHSQTKKLKKILRVLTLCDDYELKQVAISEYGLLTDDLRKEIWPKLAGVDIYSTSPKPTTKEMENHPYYQQVILDVNRSLKRFPPSIKEKQRLAMQDQLVLLIMRVLVKNPELHYYQGYHDICVTFLLVLGEEMAFHVVNQLSLSHLAIFMRKTMEPTNHMLQYMFPVIEKENSELFKFLEESDVGIMFSLSWLITWFGHVLNNYSDVVRLFDLFIVSSHWLPVYLSAAIVLYREKEILKQECDMPCVHSLLSDIPDDLPFENLISDCIRLFEKYPPKSLDKIVSERMKQKQDNLKVNRRHTTLISRLNIIAHTVMPNSKFTIPFVVAAAVAVSAVLYQTYKTN